MSGDSTLPELVSALLDEYKELRADIRIRVDLQHRNMNVLVVLLTAITGYLVGYIGLQQNKGSTSFYPEPIGLLASLVPLVVNVFIWRHLDHDLNIIDQAGYTQEKLRPQLINALGQQVLGFESYLHVRRLQRPRSLGPLADLEKEDIPMFFFLAIYLGIGWYVATYNGINDGTEILSIGLLVVASLLSPVSLWMAIVVGRQYRTVGGSGDDSSNVDRPEPPNGPANSGAQAEAELACGSDSSE